jgi:N-methylhydantoinase A
VQYDPLDDVDEPLTGETMEEGQAAALRVGIDIGGTFTDILAFDQNANQFTIGKVLTTPNDPAAGVMDAIAAIGAATGISPSGMGQIVHGTTLVTNALIERKGARTALITTKGFRDALEIAREHRYDLYDLLLELPPPLVPRALRFELNERILSDGSVLRGPDLDDLGSIVERLQAEGIEAVGVCLIHSYVNPAHERAVGEILQRAAPDVTVSLSSEISPEIREYERTSTTVANVYVRPLTERYLSNLVTAFEGAGFTGTVNIMLSSGGLCTVNAAKRFPIRLVESGPAAGALAAAHIGKASGRQRVLSFDMGGTTAKCCLIGPEGPSHSAEFEVSRMYRFKQGSGLPVSVPVIEMIEIGAGGGSIARIDSLGLLKVGPDSAGADPGPACYGKGGVQATVTDADLLLGYLDPGHFLGGDMRLDVSAARNAVGELGERLGMTVEETAWGIHQIVNEQMAGAARVHAIERGEDARSYPLFAFGGAGPVHAYRVAEILRCPEIIVPFGAGVGSTIGFLVAPVAFDYVRTLVGQLEHFAWPEVMRRFDEMETEGRETIEAAGILPEQISIRRFAEMRYVGQGHQIQVELPGGELDASRVEALRERFESEYERLYGRTAKGNPIEAVNWRVVASAPPPVVPLEQFGAADSSRPASPRERAIYLPETGRFDTVPVFDRYALVSGFEHDGPMIIEERESTIVVGTDSRVSVDALNNIVIMLHQSR